MSACATMLTRQAQSSSGPSSGSWARKRIPASTPLAAPVCSTRLPARTSSAITANEKKYVPASTTSTVAGLVAAISTPASTGPENLGELRAAAENRAAARDEPFVLADHLRQDQRATTGSRSPRSYPIANVAASSAANERWCVHQRIGTSVISGPRAASARSIDALRAEAGDERAGEDAEEPERRELGGEHPAHPRRRAGRREHEPRERDEGHRGAGERDELGAERRRGASGS